MHVSLGGFLWCLLLALLSALHGLQWDSTRSDWGKKKAKTETKTKVNKRRRWLGGGEEGNEKSTQHENVLAENASSPS